MYIEGFGFSGYRSFGEELQLFGPCTKVNLLIGQNNSGKSNVLSFLNHRYQEGLRAAREEAAENRKSGDAFDLHIGGSDSTHVAFGMTLDGDLHNRLIQQFRNHPDAIPLTSRINTVLRAKALTRGGQVAWFPYQANRGEPLDLTREVTDLIVAEQILKDHQWFDLWCSLTNRHGGDLKQNWVPDILHQLAPIKNQPPRVQLIPAIRRVGEPGAEIDGDLSGLGLINRLARLQNPAIGERDAVERFREITDFVREVSGNRSARLEIPYERDMILVEMDGKLLPLHRLGTGIHEVVILAAAATVVRDQILCIEEPELHLHPTLQRKLIRYLDEHTSNQYFITTHSAHLLDTPGAAVFHIRHEDGASFVDAASTATKKAAVCADLGYRASDLLQANSVIWVEGPSDRIYLNHWLRTVAPDLVEGLHYSIMFYGGRLLSHLTADDPEVEEFISLRRLNRYITILMDSDRPSARSRINQTKQRLRDEFNKGPGFAWITQGREIENYVAHALLETAVKSLHPDARGLAHSGFYDHALPFRTTNGKLVERVDKVKVAHKVASFPADLTIMDLSQMIDRLVRFIRSANDTDMV